jgi:hypothetical protein
LKKSIKGLFVITLICLLFTSFLNVRKAVLAEEENQMLPNSDVISEYKYVNLLNSVTTKDGFDHLVNGLSDQELFQLIAETADKMEKEGESKLSIFNEHFVNRLLNKLTENDYVTIIRNSSYSDLLKAYLIDAHDFTNKKSKKDNSPSFNNVLREVVKDEEASSGLRAYALTSISDLSLNDIQMLDSILDSDSLQGSFKVVALKAIKIIDEEVAFHRSRDILLLYTAQPSELVNFAMKVLIRTSQGESIVGMDDYLHVNIIENVINSTDDQLIVDEAFFALGELKHQKAVEIVLKYKDKIQDKSLITYFVDKNFSTVEKMLSASEDYNVSNALSIIEIAPYREFTPQLKALVNRIQDITLKTRAVGLLNLISDSEMSHNTKWDSKGLSTAEVK